MSPPEIDYSLYLVTDSTPAILGDKDLVAVVKGAIEGGATVVQYRDKTSSTTHLVRIAKALHRVTTPAKVPLLINDRIDVALAAGVEGVHLGQDDLDLKTARKLLGPNAIIGVTANTEEEAIVAARDGADYLGIGTVFATPTKENTKSIIGTAGVQRILHSLANQALDVKTVGIGGVNASNVQRVLLQAASPKKSLDGVAVVSAIVAAEDAKQAASNLRRLIRDPPPRASGSTPAPLLSSHAVIATAPALVKRLAETKPLCHHMTNLVVQNFAANVALAVGASPIMSTHAREAPDLAALGGALVINMGTATAEMQEQYLPALSAYNAVGGPVLYDPVGAGATAHRREGVQTLLAGGYFTVIKGNEGEIRTVAGATAVQQHGVDSGAAQLSLDERIALVKATAAREHTVVLMTGVTDVISDGARTVTIRNGHELLGEITGSGCTLGTTIACLLAVERDDALVAAVTAILMYEIAAERAAARATVHGPGTFVPAFLDELYRIRHDSAAGDGSWATAAQLEIV